MSMIRKGLDWFANLHWFAKLSIRLGFGVMCCFYIVALFAHYVAPVVPNYIAAITIVDGALEAAPAALASGVCAGLICDVTYKKSEPKQ